MITIHRVPIDIDESRLETEERDLLVRVASIGTSSLPPISIELLDRPLWPLPSRSESGEFSWSDTTVRLTHALYCAEFTPLDGKVRFYRSSTSAGILNLVLQTAIANALPLHGGLVLHAAAVATSKSAFGFFGRSGAGKTTISSAWPGRILSDELVAVHDFGATLSSADVGRTAFADELPLSGLFELRNGDRFSVERLAPDDAIRSLTTATQVHPIAPLWTVALSVISKIAENVPVFRLSWKKGELPWEKLASIMSDEKER